MPAQDCELKAMVRARGWHPDGREVADLPLRGLWRFRYRSPETQREGAVLLIRAPTQRAAMRLLLDRLAWHQHAAGTTRADRGGAPPDTPLVSERDCQGR
jgi:hypothetical protein